MQETLFKSRDERQKEACIKWFSNKCCGSIVAPTGLGKTRIGLRCLKAFIDKYPQMRFLVIVPTDNLKVQWEQQLDNWELSLNGSVEIINTAIKRNYKIDILCMDEVHRYNADLNRNLFKAVEYKYILGLTATFERLDEKHKEVMEKFCPVIDKISLEEALLNNWISQYKEYQVLLDVDDIDEYKVYNKEFTEHFEFFGFDWNAVNRCLGKNGFIERAKMRDERCPNGTEEQRKAMFKAITYHATSFMRCLQKRKAFINNHPKKIEIARRIIEARPNAKIITFSNNVKMAESIGCGGLVYTGKDSKKKARANLEEFNLQKTGICHSVKKLCEGADIQGLSVAIMLGIDSSEIRATQSKGRVIRFEEGKTAEIFNLIIDQTVECQWMKNSHKNADYITIDEQGLNDVLNGKEPKPYTRKIKDFTLRY